MQSQYDPRGTAPYVYGAIAFELRNIARKQAVGEASRRRYDPPPQVVAAPSRIEMVARGRIEPIVVIMGGLILERPGFPYQTGGVPAEEFFRERDMLMRHPRGQLQDVVQRHE